MQTDMIIQTLSNTFQAIKWRKSETHERLEWYFAENNVYVVHDIETNGYWFIKAKSPAKACDNVATRLGEL